MRYLQRVACLSLTALCLLVTAAKAQVPIEDKLQNKLDEKVKGGQKSGKAVVFYKLTVLKKGSKRPLANLPVKAIEGSSLRQVKGKTNSNGSVRLRLQKGDKWKISAGKMENFRQVETQPNKLLKMRDTLVYDLAEYRRKQKQTLNRSKADYEVINQSKINRRSEYSADECLLAVRVVSPKGRRLSGIPVKMVNTQASVIYENTTNQQGRAYFVLPNNSQYDIDVKGLKNYHYYDLGQETGLRKLTLEYLPTRVQEKVMGDTIFQKVSTQSRPSTKRARIKVNVKGNAYESGEKVYLEQLKTGKVYTAKINQKGNAYFLLPIQYVYMINFQYQQNVDAINLKHADELTSGETKVTYRPDPRLKYPEKYIPSPEHLILKGFNAYGKRQFKKPEAKPFNLEIAQSSKLHAEARQACFTIKLAGSDQYPNAERPPLNVAFVLDKSGSMYANERANYLKKALREVGQYLKPHDMARVIFFDTEAYEVLHSRNDHMENLAFVIDNYQPKGQTNIYKGLRLAVERLQSTKYQNQPKKVVLLTDGLGQTPPKKVIGYVADQQQQGISFSTIGVGNTINQGLLKYIAETGNGRFSYADSSIRLSKQFLKNVKHAFSYAVSDLKVEVYHDDKLLFSQLHGYPAQQSEDNKVTFEVGKVSRYTNRLAFLTFRLKDPAPAMEAKPLTVKVSYYDRLKGKRISYKENVRLSWSGKAEKAYTFDPEEKRLYAIAVLNRALKNMAKAHEQGNNKPARQGLQKAVGEVHSLYPETPPKSVKKLLSKSNKYLNLFSRMKQED